jgi:hypothetical protein
MKMLKSIKAPHFWRFIRVLLTYLHLELVVSLFETRILFAPEDDDPLREVLESVLGHRNDHLD